MAGVKPSLWDAFKQYLGDAAPGGALNPEVTPQGLLDVAAMASMPVPVVGDAIGLAADAKRLRDNPEERSLLNYVLMAAGALPLVPSGLSAASKTLDKAGDARRTRTKYEIAHEIAQRNAALPVEKGGLGLPPDNTAMDRAKAMGFDYVRRSQKANDPFNDVGYGMFAEHSGDIDGALDSLSNYGKGKWLGRADVSVHDIQKDMIRSIRSRGLNDEYGTTAAALVREANPERIVNSAGLWDAPKLAEAAIEDAALKGIDGVKTYDGAVIWSPKNIRSRRAAFDPMKRDSSDLLAGIGVPILSGGLLALLMGSEDAQAGQ